MSRTLKGFFVMAALAVVAGHVGVGYVVSDGTTVVGQPGETVGENLPGIEDGITENAGGPIGKQGPSRTGTGTQAAAGLACAPGRNGGKRGVGVSGSEIKIAMTAVQDGEAASLLAPAITGVKVVFDRVNAAGGICGRVLKLRVDNDSFDAKLGHQYIENYIDGDVFALVSPSAEGLSSAITAGDISRAGIPVVGTDGLRKEQYGSPWVWPVGTATQSTMRVMAEYGYRSMNARSFAIVWDSKYKFGIEGRDEFVKQVEAMGGKVVADQKLDPAQAGYNTEALAFNEACENGKCDMVAMLLLPDTAEKWIAQQPAKGRLYTAGAQTLFSDRFAQKCVNRAKTICNGIAVWTGYNPPIDRYKTLPDIATYAADVRSVSPGADITNQFLEGAYLGAQLLVEAIKKAGPDLTRAALRRALDSMTLKTDFASKLAWRPGNHSANVTARSFSMVVAQGNFTGWRDERTGFLVDPKWKG